MQVQDTAIDQLTPYERNPRLNSDAVERVAASIKAYGFRQPIVTDEDGVILVGHTRHAAAKLLGLETVPVHVAAGLTDEQKRAYRIADNKTAEFSRWDEKLLRFEIGELVAFGLEELPGFDTSELRSYAGLVEDGKFPDLGAGERAGPGTMTFVLQAEERQAVQKAVRIAGEGLSTADGSNKNGAALALICRDYLRGHGHR